MTLTLQRKTEQCGNKWEEDYFKGLADNLNSKVGKVDLLYIMII